jgi:hypothetical protein
MRVNAVQYAFEHALIAWNAKFWARGETKNLLSAIKQCLEERMLQ